MFSWFDESGVQNGAAIFKDDLPFSIVFGSSTIRGAEA
jgi:hypothetical protein